MWFFIFHFMISGQPCGTIYTNPIHTQLTHDQWPAMWNKIHWPYTHPTDSWSVASYVEQDTLTLYTPNWLMISGQACVTRYIDSYTDSNDSRCVTSKQYCTYLTNRSCGTVESDETSNSLYADTDGSNSVTDQQQMIQEGYHLFLHWHQV